MANRAHVDCETASPVDLRRSGVHRYAEHLATRLWVFAWRIEDNERCIVASGLWYPDDPDPVPLLEHVAAGLVVVAHNNAFDRTIWNKIIRRLCPHWPVWTIKQSDCTVARAAVLGVPQGLEFVAPVLGIEQRKDEAGARLMRQMMRPKDTLVCTTCAGRGCATCQYLGVVYTWNDEPEKQLRIGQYCATDVDVESAVDAICPHLSAYERLVWECDQRTNEAGIQLDTTLIERAKKVVEIAKVRLDKRMNALTDGAVSKATQAQALAGWLQYLNIPCATVAKGAHDELHLFAEVLDRPEVAEALEIRRAGSKTSTAKLWAMTDCVCADGRARGLLHYHSAHTGRWAGRLIQPQNLYRVDEERDGRDIERAFEILARDITPQEAHDQLEMIVGEPMECIAKCLRRFIIAASGRKFVGGDLSNIEGCVNVWLAGEGWKVQAYFDYQNRVGPDLYKVAYSRSFNIPAEEVNSLQRQIGKVMELALGYQGSVGAFYTMSQTYLLKLTDLLPIIREATLDTTWQKALWLYDIAPATRRYGLPRDLWAGLKVIVDNWRAAHPATCQSWWDQQDAAIEAVAQPGTVTACCNDRIKYCADRGFLWCQLPSGRTLAYCRPRLVRKDRSDALRRFAAPRAYNCPPDVTETTKAEELARAVWKAGNRHGPDAERKAEILRLCTEALSASDALPPGFRTFKCARQHVLVNPDGHQSIWPDASEMRNSAWDWWNDVRNETDV